MSLTVEKVRSPQWDKSNLWDIKIDGIYGVKGFIPSIDIEFGFHGIQNGTVGNSSLEFAQTTTFPIFTMSYIDDEKLTFTKQLANWQSQIVSENGLVVQPPETASKLILIEKLSSLRNVKETFTLKGFPTGQINYHGDSDGSAPVYSVQFTITGSDIHMPS